MTENNKTIEEENVQPETNTMAINNKYELTPEDKHKINEITKNLKVDDPSSIIRYGAETQKELTKFSEGMLNRVTVKQTGAIGDELSSLMTKLNEVNPEELSPSETGFFGRFFGKIKKNINEVTMKYQKMSTQIDTISNNLNMSQQNLIKDGQMLDGLYEKNKEYFNQLNLYIAAAKKKQDELKNELIPQAREVAKNTDNQMAAQEVNDLLNFESRLDKRIYDLETTRQISIQQAPQIRLIQNENQVLAEKIQSSINTAIPLWKNQVAVALTLLRQRQAVNAQRAVSETTNDLLKNNAEMLKISTIETAKENERSVVDVETLNETQSKLMETLTEALEIQKEGKAKRIEATQKLNQMEDELKNNLLKYSRDEQRRDVTDDATEY